MGKFDGVLLLSDFDNTLVYTEEVLLSGGRLPPLNSAKPGAPRVFHGRGRHLLRGHRPGPAQLCPHCPHTAHERADHPFNGAALYDFAREEYLKQRFCRRTYGKS